MGTPLQLILDLGDLLTKGLLLDPLEPRRFGFPSIVASQLVDPAAVPGGLATDPGRAPLRLDGFDAADFPRLRSFPEAARLAEAPPVAGARYAGWLAATCGVDRQVLGDHPTADNIDALVRKALMKAGVRAGEVELIFLVDAGAKGAAIARYAASLPRTVEFLAWTVQPGDPRPVRVALRARLLDAARCALAALPRELAVDRVGQVMLIDVGYLRTKLAVLSADGCERQEEVEAGVAGCVARVLRDGQELGLVEDEIAVIRALERSQRHIEVAGRRFEVAPSLDDARRALAADVARAAARVAVEQYERRGHGCRAVAIVGGGAAVLGEALAARLDEAGVGFQPIWICPDTRFHHLAGAELLLAGASVASS